MCIIIRGKKKHLSLSDVNSGVVVVKTRRFFAFHECILGLVREPLLVVVCSQEYVLWMSVRVHLEIFWQNDGVNKMVYQVLISFHMLLIPCPLEFSAFDDKYYVCRQG